MELRLDGKVAVVTGGSRGIGKGIAKAYVEAGGNVMLVSRKAETLEATAAELAGTGGDVAVFPAHVGGFVRHHGVMADLDVLGERTARGCNVHAGHAEVNLERRLGAVDHERRHVMEERRQHLVLESAVQFLFKQCSSILSERKRERERKKE